MKRPGALTGALAGLLLTVPLIIIYYLGMLLAGLPFVPFNIFDWITRRLPGSIITFNIELMVKIIRGLNLGSTAGVAKTAEQTIAITLFLAGGIIAGAILFVLVNKLKKSAFVSLLIAGIIIGILVVIISYSKLTFLGGVWIIITFLTWGALLGWSYRNLYIPIRVSTAHGKFEPSPDGFNGRRRFLIKLGIVAAVFAAAGILIKIFTQMVPAGMRTDRGRTKNERWSANNPLPNANDPVKPAPGTRPEFTPLENHYRIDIDTMPPSIEMGKWRLKITGLVDHPVELTLADIRGYEPMHQFITLACISNPVAGDLTSTTRWTGVSFQSILPDLKLKPSATHLKITSADDFWEIVSLDKIKNDKRIMLTYAWDGVPLLAEHGYPLRIYIPDLYGMKQPKWIISMEATDHWEPGYWVVRDWDRTAQMKATSVIDTVAANAIFTGADGRKLVPVGGIAHAGARGISKVEVRVDNEGWNEAKLRTPLSELTWVIWRYDMPYQTGTHTITVRCYDGNGKPQPVDPTPPHPDGAAGLHSVSVTI